MKRLFVVAAIAAAPPLGSLVGCEGEPPINGPENTIAAPSAAGSASASGGTAEVPPSPSSAAMTACPPPPCAPAPSASVAVAVAPKPGGAGAAEADASSSPASAIPPAAILRGNIVGSLTTKPAGSMGQAVVYLEDGPVDDAPPNLQTVTIDNRQMSFIPFVSVVAVGGKVVFANADPFPHNVFSPDNDKFNMGNIPQNGAHFRIFKAPGAYSLLCNLHPGMLGYLMVTPSTWFTRADAKGTFVMKHVPAGTYKVTAWAPRQSPVTQPVVVAEGDVTIHFDLHR